MLSKPIFWALSLCLVFFTGDRLVGFWLKKQTASSQFRYSRMYGGRGDADILLVGNSRGLAFYQPYIEKITGKSTFNISYNGLPAQLAKVLVADYLEKYPSPKTILIDITLCDRTNTTLIAGFSTYLPDSHRLDTLIRGQSNDVWWGNQISALFRYNNEVFQRAMFYRNRSDEDWLIDRQIAPTLAATVPLDTFPVSIQPALISELAAMVALARAAGHDIRLIIGPYYPGMVRDWKNLLDLKTAVEKSTGLQVYDFSQALKDPADFGDLMHPNKQGAIHFANLLPF